MGDLPNERVQGFLNPFAGLNYAGPLQEVVYKTKALIAVFTCLATNGIQLEIVSQLVTKAFLLGLGRFVARRGLCSKMISVNGTNFLGAASELKTVYTFLENDRQAIADHWARQGNACKFSPPRATHFGGLWEAAMKAMKKHLNMVTKGLVCTFEE